MNIVHIVLVLCDCLRCICWCVVEYVCSVGEPSYDLTVKEVLSGEIKVW